jgi:FHA domain
MPAVSVFSALIGAGLHRTTTLPPFDLMLTDDVRYEVGLGIAFVAPGRVLLVGGELDKRTSDGLWAAVRSGCDFEELVDALAAVGLRRLDSVGVICIDGNEVRLLVRRRITATIHGLEQPESLSAEGVVTWVERLIDTPLAIELRVGSEEVGTSFPFGSGVVHAGAIWIGAPMVGSEKEVDGPVDDDDTSQMGRRSEPEGAAERRVATGESDATSQAGSGPFASKGPSGDSLETPTESDDEFDDLFGATQDRAVEGAAVRTDAERPFSVTATPSFEGDENAPDIPPPAIPASLPTSKLPSQEDAPRDRVSPSASETEPQGDPRPEIPHGPDVHGVRCEKGHPNPPQASLCRICRAELPGTRPVTMSRPVLGHLRFSNGIEVPLDRPVIIGRLPRAERVSGNEIPQLVTLPSPEQNISRNHVEIRLVEWDVIVIDLESMNGTIVTNPGQPPHALRAGEEVQITPGAVVAVADEITFTYEVP